MDEFGWPRAIAVVAVCILFGLLSRWAILEDRRERQNDDSWD